jgi:hypothetical protein
VAVSSRIKSQPRSCSSPTVAARQLDGKLDFRPNVNARSVRVRDVVAALGLLDENSRPLKYSPAPSTLLLSLLCAQDVHHDNPTALQQSTLFRRAALDPTLISRQTASTVALTLFLRDLFDPLVSTSASFASITIEHRRSRASSQHPRFKPIHHARALSL